MMTPKESALRDEWAGMLRTSVTRVAWTRPSRMMGAMPGARP